MRAVRCWQLRCICRQAQMFQVANFVLAAVMIGLVAWFNAQASDAMDFSPLKYWKSVAPQISLRDYTKAYTSDLYQVPVEPTATMNEQCSGTPQVCAQEPQERQYCVPGSNEVCCCW